MVGFVIYHSSADRFDGEVRCNKNRLIGDSFPPDGLSSDDRASKKKKVPRTSAAKMKVANSMGNCDSNLYLIIVYLKRDRTLAAIMIAPISFVEGTTGMGLGTGEM